jgi:hypothetical protein
MTPVEISSAGIEMCQRCTRWRPKKPPTPTANSESTNTRSAMPRSAAGSSARGLLRERPDDLLGAERDEEQGEDLARPDHAPPCGVVGDPPPVTYPRQQPDLATRS